MSLDEFPVYKGGEVPEDHVVGKPLFIWLSTDGNRSFPKNIRWRRFFKFV